MSKERTIDKTEDRLARLLAETLADRALWRSLAEIPDDEGWRDAVAARALDLYEYTSPIIESRVTQAPAEPMDWGIAMLREVADACAILSHRWPREKRAQLGIPTRALIEFGIRASGVDEWAAQLGWPLEIAESSGMEEAWASERERVKDHLSGNELASAFADLMYTFERFMDARETEAGREALNSEGAREGACELLGLSRGWLIWSRGRLDSGAESVAASMVFMSQGCFIASRCLTPSGEFFPTKDFLRTLLHFTGASDWLSEEDVDLPDWLA